MCLRKILPLEDREKFINDIGEDGITVYKVVAIEKDGYYPVAKKTKTGYKDGLNEAIVSTISIDMSFNSYDAGFHFYLSKEEAEAYFQYLHDLVDDDGWYQHVLYIAKDEGETVHKQYRLVECIVKKEWITMIGQESSGLNLSVGNTRWGKDDSATVIVSEKAIFPKFIKIT